MKHLFILNFVFFFFCSKLWAQKENCFSLASIQGAITTKKNINLEFNKSCSFNPFKKEEKLSGLSLDVEIKKDSADYLVRIILNDKEGTEYLILEAFNELSAEDKITLSDYGEETLILDNVSPKSISLFVKNATVNIKYITTALQKEPLRTSILNEKKKKLREQQAIEKANKINTYNHLQNKLWIAGVSPLSRKTYEVRKRILNMSNDSNTGGYEYYIGGIFEVGNTKSPNADHTQYSSLYTDKFDWRYQHGKTDNYWITSIKNQGDSGFCVFFSIIACAEALINLYYNTNHNFDLSEMELAWCCGIPNPYLGVTHSENNLPFEYLINHGVMKIPTHLLTHLMILVEVQTLTIMNQLRLQVSTM